MIWFEYKYNTFSEVIKNIKILTQYSVVDLIMLFSLLIVIILFIFYIIPISKVYIDSQKLKKEKAKKREFLRKISLQKDIEDKIAKEINIR